MARNLAEWREFALAIHPVDGNARISASTRDVNKFSVVRKRELSAASEGIRRHTFEDRYGLAGNLQPLQIEGRGEERPGVAG